MPRVVVFGSSNTDMTVRLPTLPAPGQTMLGRSFLTALGGKGANQAVAACRAGAEVVFITAVGDDDLGRAALEGYRREGIDVRFARVVPGMASGVALIFVDDRGENMIGVASGANLALTPEDVNRLPDELFRAGDVLLVGLEIPMATALCALERGEAAGMLTILNPAPVPDLSVSEARGLIAAARVITPNRMEAAALAVALAEAAGLDAHANQECSDPDLEDASRVIELRSWGDGRDVVMTRGGRGCVAASKLGLRWIPAVKVDVVDTVGAGDAFTGALAVKLAEGRGLFQAATWAGVAAALAVTRAGAQPSLPYRRDIEELAALAEASDSLNGPQRVEETSEGSG
ncbi:MAG: ribokinase [Isosphaeraceae bacterium]